jgi:hypothetical protein
MLHYCYGDAEFNKRNFTTADDVRTAVWQARAEKNLANAVICEQLKQAAAFYGLHENRYTADTMAGL